MQLRKSGLHYEKKKEKRKTFQRLGRAEIASKCGSWGLKQPKILVREGVYEIHKDKRIVRFLFNLTTKNKTGVER